MAKYYICITPFFPSEESFRGPYVLDQIKAIAQCSNYKVIVLKPTTFFAQEEDYEFDGVNVYRFVDYNLPSNIWPNSITDRLTFRSMLKTLRRVGVNISDIEVAHSHVTRNGAFANSLKRLNPNIISVVQHHGFDVMSLTDGRLADYGFHKRRCIRYGARICNTADLNIGVSRRTLEYVKETPGINLQKEYVLYNGVDTQIFHPAATAKPKEETFRIGCVANFWSIKDQITLVKAVENLVAEGFNNIQTIFVGTGSTRQACEDYIKHHKLNNYFEFIDSMHHDALPEFYRSLNLFVLPSYWEAFGCVYTEAYACGVPFIGVKDQGIAEIVAPECADRWLIDKSDSAQLAELIKLSIEETEEINNLNTPVDIRILIANFLQSLNQLQCNH